MMPAPFPTPHRNYVFSMQQFRCSGEAMIAGVYPGGEPAGAPRRFTVTPLVELAVLALAVAVAIGSYFVIVNQNAPRLVLAPPLVAFLLIANLLPGIALMMLLGRRIARRRAARSPLGGEGRLHVRLVAVFSLMASLPIVLTVIAASVMFQSGVQLWGSERARGALNATVALAKEGQNLVVQRWAGEARTMAADITGKFPRIRAGSPEIQEYLLSQTYFRNFYQSVLFKVADGRRIEALYEYEAPPADVFARRISGQVLNVLRDQDSYTNFDSTMLWVVTPIARANNLFLYVGTPNNVDFLSRQNSAADKVFADYDALQQRARVLQFRFNAALFVVALLIVGLATWIALAVADRLVRPVGELVDAARRVERGDLSARVPETIERDEVGTLSNAFNRMTGQLQEQNNALVTANAQLDSRRALIEAVMSGVSAGVVSIGADRTIRLINSSARTLLGTGEESPIGRALRDIAPELDDLLDGDAREAIVHVSPGGEAKTLAVRIARDGTGPILTFDDITQQLLDQRRAAWSDVARRIAHEIKNPLTPIQLAAERLQRRYGGKVEAGDGVFAQLTETIVRQVGDLRRMVDEFSSFAQMPKPVFREESLVDIARQTMFLHEVAHSSVRFALVHDDPGPILVCDRRQIGQALTNIVKNAIEAIEAAGGAGEVTMTLSDPPDTATILVEDTGVGLPRERDRIVEPYMTTRARGTGLGLAIVKKIVEDHCGTITFSDRAEKGTAVTMTFDTILLAGLDGGGDCFDTRDDGRLATLTRAS